MPLWIQTSILVKVLLVCVCVSVCNHFLHERRVCRDGKESVEGEHVRRVRRVWKEGVLGL